MTQNVHFFAQFVCVKTFSGKAVFFGRIFSVKIRGKKETPKKDPPWGFRKDPKSRIKIIFGAGVYSMWRQARSWPWRPKWGDSKSFIWGPRGILLISTIFKKLLKFNFLTPKFRPPKKKSKRAKTVQNRPYQGLGSDKQECQTNRLVAHTSKCAKM